MNEDKYIADGKWIKGLFHLSITWQWVHKSLVDYITNEMPWQMTHWFIIDKNDNLKIYRKFYNIMSNSIYDSISAMIEDSNIKHIVGPISKYYNMEYFIEYLTNNNIEFNKELDNEGKWKLFL